MTKPSVVNCVAATLVFLTVVLSVTSADCQNSVMLQGSPDPNQMQAMQLMQQGMAKLQAKDSRGAQPLLEQAVQMWPQMPHIHYYLGFCYNDSGQYARAIPEFQQAIQSDPQRVDCMINIATCYQLTGQPGEAANWFERYLHEKPSSPRAGQIKSMIPALRNQAKKAGNPATSSNEGDYLSALKINCRWSQRSPLRVYIANGTNEANAPLQGFRPNYNYILSQSLATWITASGNKLAVQYVTEASQADMLFFWTDDPNFHKGAGQPEQGTANVQFRPLPDGSKEIWRAVTTILIHSRQGGVLDDTQMARTCLHEVGHALGLQGHSLNATDIMFYSELPSGQAVLSDRDQRTIARLYQTYAPVQ